MISDITLGQFFPGNSTLHKSDPRTKIIGSILFMATVFVAKNLFAYLLLLAATLLLAALGHIKLKMLWKSVRPLLIVLLFTGILNLFFTKGAGEPLFAWHFLEIYEEGLWRALLMAIRVVLLVAGASLLLTYTTSPIELTDGLESLLSPLKKLHLPVHEFAMMMTIALRFIPTLTEETEKIMCAQKARGADFSSGGLVKRAKALVPILVPLFVSAFNRAFDLASAMECRCYHGGEGRTRLKVLRYHAVDWLSFGVVVVFCVGLILLNRLGIGYVMK